MTSRTKILQGRLLASTVFASAALIASPAYAQDDPPAQAADERGEGAIVITGTLVRNPNLVSSSPINVTGEEEIELQQANVAEELLRELPGAVPSIGSAVNNGNGGNSFVKLFNCKRVILCCIRFVTRLKSSVDYCVTILDLFLLCLKLGLRLFCFRCSCLRRGLPGRVRTAFRSTPHLIFR
mgnify:CR=1 FL=1